MFEQEFLIVSWMKVMVGGVGVGCGGNAGLGYEDVDERDGIREVWSKGK